MVRGDLKQMTQEYVRGATFQRYGTTLYVGIGIPIPILDEDLARFTAVTDEQITTKILDYGVPRRDRPVVKETNYAELRSGQVTINGREVPVSPLSSIKASRKIAEELKAWITGGGFTITTPIERLPTGVKFKPMRAETKIPFVEEIATGKLVMGTGGLSIDEAAKLLIHEGADSLIIQDSEGALVGILTPWDIAKALGTGSKLVEEVMSRKVIVAHKGEPIDLAARKLEKHRFSSLPIIDSKRKTLGIISEDDIARFVGRRKW
jgi:CBS domain-containing protein